MRNPQLHANIEDTSEFDTGKVIYNRSKRLEYLETLNLSK